jgi:hypothetical protein
MASTVLVLCRGISRKEKLMNEGPLSVPAMPATRGFAYILLALGMVVAAHVSDLSADHDDKGYYRAASYAMRYGNTAMKQDIRTDLIKKGYENAALRLSWGSYYVANTYLVALFEKLPIYSAFQTVFLAHLSLHLIALLFLLLTLWLLFGASAGLLFPIFLLSLTSCVFVCDWLFPFANHFFSPVTWITCYPRGSATLFVFTALLCFMPQGTSRIPFVARLIMGCFLLGLSFLCHSAEAEIYGAVLVAALAVYRFGKIDFPAIFKFPGKVKKMLWVINLIIASIIFVKTVGFILYVVLMGSFSPSHLYGSNSIRAFAAISVVLFLLYLLATNALILFWAGVRRVADESDSLTQIGDHLFRFFVPFAVVLLGLYPLSPTSYDNLNTNTLLFYEASRRLMGMPHILWWMVFGIGLYLKYGRTRRRIVHRVLFAWLFLIFLSMGMDIRVSFKENPGVVHRLLLNKTLVCLRESEIPDASSVNALTENEIYHTIVNEFRSRLGMQCHGR